MKTKLSLLKDCVAQNDWEKAIAIAAKFPRLGAERNAILDADMAIKNRNFCIAIKKCPDTLIAQGIATIKAKYNI